MWSRAGAGRRGAGLYYCHRRAAATPGGGFRGCQEQRRPSAAVWQAPPRCSWRFASSSSSAASSSSNKNNSHHHPSPSRSRTAASARGAGAAVVFAGGVVAARWWYGNLFATEDSSSDDNQQRRRRGGLLPDTSRATVVLQNVPLPPAAAAAASSSVKKNNKNTTTVDASEWDAFLRAQRAMLRRAADESRKAAESTLHRELQGAVEDAATRIDRFCDWYLSYSTTYQLLGWALQSAARHAVAMRMSKDDDGGGGEGSSNATTLTERIGLDLETEVARKYEAIVLRPAWTDPLLHRAVVRTLQTAFEKHYQPSVAALDASLADFVAEHGHRTAILPQHVILRLDWRAQRQKIQHVPAAYDKGSGQLRTVALVTAGAAAGKVAGAATAAAASGKAATVALSGGGATKALLAKLAAPFATKAATGAAALGGPVGAALGLGVDLGVNAVTGRMQRPALEQDVRDALVATVSEWEHNVLLPEVQRVQNVWYQHAEGLLLLQQQQQQNGDGVQENPKQ